MDCLEGNVMSVVLLSLSRLPEEPFTVDLQKLKYNR